MLLFLAVLPRPPRSPLFPYTTLFRSLASSAAQSCTSLTPGCCLGGCHRSRHAGCPIGTRSEEHTSELQSHSDLVCRLLLEKKKKEESTRSGASENDRDFSSF